MSNARLDAIKAGLRKRHGLGADAKVGITTMPAAYDLDSGDPHAFTATISKRVIDRDNEVLLPSGCITTEFDRSGIVAWNHDYDRPVAIPGEVTVTEDAVTCRARFLSRPDDWSAGAPFDPDFARAFVSQMQQHGKAAGVSVGFETLDERRPTKKDVEDYGERCTSVITRYKLYEWSIAPVQSNPEAVVSAVGKSLGAAACKALFGVGPPDADADPPADDEPPAQPARKRVIIIVPAATPRPPAPRMKRKRRARPRPEDVQEIAERIVETRLNGLLFA